MASTNAKSHDRLERYPPQIRWWKKQTDKFCLEGHLYCEWNAPTEQWGSDERAVILALVIPILLRKGGSNGPLRRKKLVRGLKIDE